MNCRIKKKLPFLTDNIMVFLHIILTWTGKHFEIVAIFVLC